MTLKQSLQYLPPADLQSGTVVHQPCALDLWALLIFDIQPIVLIKRIWKKTFKSPYCDVGLQKVEPLV